MSDIFSKLDSLSAEYAEAQSTVEYLEEFKKSKLALLMKEAEIKGHNTAAAQEREARSSKEYLELLEGLRVATEQAIRAKWALKKFEMEFERWRTKESTKRAEMNLR
jgi:hypothetical protein